ncbi:japanin-like-RS isoform X2 [Rhipicephalus microplus]|uniref:japanin-like-RS isoform X2 n=1 Tax=Rhipicephalus microplus TaxID=6941 RepID=UPI003F6D8DBF
MKLSRCHHFSFHLLVSAITTTSTSTIIMPGVSKQTLYLVGYSEKLHIRNVECVKTRYQHQKGEWVLRSLIYVFAVADRPWVLQSAAFEVSWKEYAALLHTKASEYVRYNLKVKPEYLIRTYDESTLLLSDVKDTSPVTFRKPVWNTLDHTVRTS